MAESRQESCTSDGVVKVTPQKRYRLGIEMVSLKGLMAVLLVIVNLQLLSKSCPYVGHKLLFPTA